MKKQPKGERITIHRAWFADSRPAVQLPVINDWIQSFRGHFVVSGLPRM